MQAQVKEWEMVNSDGGIMLVKRLRHKTLEERADEYGGQLNLDGEYDWGVPDGKDFFTCNQ